MRVNADSLLIRAAATSTSGTLNDLTTDLIMANNNNNSALLPTVQSLLLVRYWGWAPSVLRCYLGAEWPILPCVCAGSGGFHSCLR